MQNTLPNITYLRLFVLLEGFLNILRYNIAIAINLQLCIHVKGKKEPKTKSRERKKKKKIQRSRQPLDTYKDREASVHSKFIRNRVRLKVVYSCGIVHSSRDF